MSYEEHVVKWGWIWEAFADINTMLHYNGIDYNNICLSVCVGDCRRYYLLLCAAEGAEYDYESEKQSLLVHIE